MIDKQAIRRLRHIQEGREETFKQTHRLIVRSRVKRRQWAKLCDWDMEKPQLKKMEDEWEKRKTDNSG